MLETLTEKRSSQGIALQICDVFIPELGKVDSEQISLDQLSEVLKPFLLALGQSTSKIVQNRIKETIFNPLLESNVTLPDSEDESSDGEENLAQVDGGKLSRRTRKQVMALINQKYVFPNFNILHYAENHIFPLASAPSEQVNEANRELIYDLYYSALKLEPEPKHPELTFSQRQLMNRSRKFVTMRMKKRQEIRTTKKGRKQ